MWGKLAPVPLVLRSLLSHGLNSLSPDSWDRIFAQLQKFLPQGRGINRPGEKLHKLSIALSSRSPEDLYNRLVSAWQSEDLPVSDGVSARMSGPRVMPPDLADRMMLMDMQAYLPDDILTKVDRASMAVSLETRVPFLDHHLVEFAWTLPHTLKIDGGTGKKILRDVAHRYIPKSLMERPKMGFGVPIGQWMRGPLRDWVEDLLDQNKLAESGYFNVPLVRKRWQQHLHGHYSWGPQLWTVLMFISWHRQQTRP